MKKKPYFALALISSILISSCNQQSTSSNSSVDNSNLASISSNSTSGYQIDTDLGEKLDPNEAASTKIIEADFIQTLKDHTKNPPTQRPVHAKHHGVVKATFKIDNHLIDDKYKVGVFAENNKEYKSWIRFSNGNPPGTPSDTSPDVRGMAIKLMNVSGKKLLDSESNEQTQDFLMMNNSTFFIKSLDLYVSFTEAVKDGLSGLAKFALFHPGTTFNIVKIFTKQVANPLTTDFFSTTPYKLGSTAIKFRAKPCQDESQSRPANAGPNYLREAMVKTLNQKDACYNFMVQFRKGSLNDMPIEDSTKEWDESTSPYIKVATITIPKQTFDTPEQQKFAENLSFTPWHALPEHKPLGFTNRVRRVVYETISRFRHTQNNAPRREPSDFNINNR